MKLSGLFKGGLLAGLCPQASSPSQGLEPTNVVAIRQDATSFSREVSPPPLGKMLAVGGLVATCLAGVVTLGPTGGLLGLAGQMLAFAGGFLLSRSQRRELEETNRELLKKATTDHLTGLHNRASIFDILDDELERGEWQSTELSIILCDLDHFKYINDNYGHPAGDAVLTEVARRLAKSIRNVDSPGRYGGEEMMVVLPGATTACAREVAERIRKEVCGAPVHTIWGSIPVTMSLGVAGTDTVGCRMVMLLVQAADQALYQAKEAGRDQVVCLSA